MCHSDRSRVELRLARSGSEAVTLAGRRERRALRREVWGTQGAKMDGSPDVILRPLHRSLCHGEDDWT